MSDDVEHTPGPWIAGDPSQGVIQSASARDDSNLARTVAITDWAKDKEGREHRRSEEMRANARLIAAAPTMKERLMRLNTMLSWYLRPDVDRSPKVDEIREMLQWTEDAIAKAEDRNE